MLVRLDDRSINFLMDARISFTPNYGGTRLNVGDTLIFEDNCSIEPYCGFYAGHAICEMGHGSYSNSGIVPGMKVGRFCSIAWSVTVPRPRHPTESVSTSNFTYDRNASIVRWFIEDSGNPEIRFYRVPQKSAPRIEHDVWIGAGAALMPGIHIGTGAVIAAHSVVTKSVGPYEIWGGNPAKLIRKRFSQSTINLLLETQWWAYKLTDFTGLPFDEPERFCEGFLKRKADLEPYTPKKNLAS